MTENNRMIEMELHRLDQVACAAEAKWGIGNLLSYAPPDLKNKWEAQREKLADAVKQKDAQMVALIVDGTIRGWQALEANAVERGYKPITPEYMEVKLESGFHLRVAKNTFDARMVCEQGVVVWSLQEIARVIESEYTLVNKIKNNFQGAEMKEISKAPKHLREDMMPF